MGETKEDFSLETSINFFQLWESFKVVSSSGPVTPGLYILADLKGQFIQKVQKTYLEFQR